MQETSNVTFSFGKNWQDFVHTSLTPERITAAKERLTEFLELSNFTGKHFLDVGCGSGLSSLAAYELGAQKIVSFDLDPDSVRTTAKLKELAGNPEHWTVLQGSILDQQFLRTLEKADIVYSWGVLHHTGQMWEAFANTANLLHETSLLYVALYTTTPKSPFWLRVKKKYNHTSVSGKRFMEYQFIGLHLLKVLLFNRKNPVRYVQEYHNNRGMSYRHDVRDWLGGYPYEDAKIEEVLQYGRKQLALELINLKTGEANTEYLFIKKHGKD
ncbi:probable 3-demethylubiquinone-9 3-methyltransferase [Candidatus Vecturithrix granuli]|uniref:Probable 3-demethylubiquinone-9 3-methyltransferase n=1 Tax=Vecturithrix granuli TaxID=1499967 RepID=A0A081BY52_VECG1|nr:probable 3-demethylubiquinone-9 3-methyltransferase [Candidatus Vecturithrix granuli]